MIKLCDIVNFASSVRSFVMWKWRDGCAEKVFINDNGNIV